MFHPTSSHHLDALKAKARHAAKLPRRHDPVPAPIRPVIAKSHGETVAKLKAIAEAKANHNSSKVLTTEPTATFSPKVFVHHGEAIQNSEHIGPEQRIAVKQFVLESHPVVNVPAPVDVAYPQR